MKKHHICLLIYLIMQLFVSIACNVKEVKINQDSVTFITNDTKRLTTNVKPFYANKKTLTWTSSDTDVATVSDNGTVTAIKMGKAVISVVAKDTGHTSNCNLLVEPNVYVAGCLLHKSGRHVATLWKNGHPQQLGNAEKGSVAYSVYVSPNDIYVAGYEVKPPSNIIQEEHDATVLATLWKNGELQLKALREARNWHVATLWKNGEPQYLSDGKNDAEANSVYVSANDIYVAGYEINAQLNKVATLWKNGEAQYLSDGKNDAEANSVYVSDLKDVYVAGYEEDPKREAKKEGSAARMWMISGSYKKQYTPDTLYARANSVYVDGGDMYLAGTGLNEFYFILRTGVSYSVLFKNLITVPLANQGALAEGKSVFVSGKNVYVAGTKSDKAVLWENTEGFKVLSDEKYSSANSVYVSSGGDVYVAGNQGARWLDEKSMALLWKNGQKSVLGNGAAYSVFLR